jgi:phage gpG-like protein
MSTVPEVTARLKALQARAPAAARTSAVAMGLLMSDEVKLNELRRYTHEAGTPTPSPPGEPPAMISGDLRGSVLPEPPVSRGLVSSVTVGGTVICARIQELGGWAGRGHASYLPARPYIKPAAERLIASGAIRAAAVRGWLASMGRA